MKQIYQHTTGNSVTSSLPKNFLGWCTLSDKIVTTEDDFIIDNLGGYILRSEYVKTIKEEDEQRG